MTKCQSSMRSEDSKPQIKYKGIHEPKGRVKGFRVEIRPPNSAQKIWVGTFDTRPKAMRAFDAAVYLTGKEPYYFVYPENYFPTRPNKPPREFVQTEAKKFADRIHDLPVNPASFLVDTSKAGSVEVSPELTPGAGKERITLMTPDVKAAEKMDFASLDEFLQNVDYRLPVPAELIPALEENSLWSLDLTVEEAKSVLRGAETDVEEPETGVKEFEAFDKGYNNPYSDLLSDLLRRDPPETFLPYIEGESVFYSPSMLPSSKRKRDAIEGAFIVTDRISVGSSERGATDVADDWWKNLFSGDPMRQSFGVVGTPNPPLWLLEDF